MTKRNFFSQKHNITKKNIKIHGYRLPKKEGWHQVVLKGTPQQRGFAHGFLLYQELEQVAKKLPFIVKHEILTTYKHYMKTCKHTIEPIIKTHYKEFYQELEAIVRGVHYQNPRTKVTMDILIGWNSLMSMYEYINNTKRSPTSKHCSAFISTGTATKTGKIVMGHTTHTDLVSGAFFNILLYMIPEKGLPFIMQTSPGSIASGTDWFLTDANIIGCETTIGDINYKPLFDNTHHPYFCRIRKAMQYANTLDQYQEIMTTYNAGDYACSWLFGNINTNQIMLCELGFNVVNVQTKNDGIFYGMNSAMSSILRTEETDDEEFFNMRTSSGARNARFQQLFEKYDGKLTPQIAIKILGDHIDPYTEKEEPNAKSICVHSYQDSHTYDPNYPHGCTDVKAIDSQMAKHKEFLARFGPACGRPFYKTPYLKKYPQYKKFEPYLEDFPHYEVTKIELKEIK